METQTIELSDFQQKVMLLPEELDVFLGGGRGGGKSYGEALLALRHAEQYGAKARILYVRQTYKGIADFELVCRELFGTVYGTAARYNAAEHIWRFPNGAVMELGQLETHSDYAKYQGRSFTLLLSDEIGQYATPDLLDILRSNLRGPKGMPIRVVLAGNPGGVGHQWIAKRYVFKAAPWKAFLEPKSKRQFVYAPSTFLDNKFIDREQYSDQLNSACPHDPELLRAWLEGDWAVARGAYFASVLDEDRNAIDPAMWQTIPTHHGYRWPSYLAHDFGSSAPSATYVVLQSPGAIGPDGRYYPRDSLVIVDELATAMPGRPQQGLGWTVPVIAEEIKAMCARWCIRPAGVADDAIFANMGHSDGSIAKEFSRCGVHFSPARKADRLTGWNIMRRLLAGAGKPDVPGLFISRACEYFWQTVPYLPRDIKRVEDVDSSAADHAADAVRYGCLRLRNEVSQIRLSGF
ncbi:MAG: phage terminase large subunit [Alphaproteobacteria bacterium]|nr:phage terminase large subunit [Alphaproteobacteria bacterium]MBU2082605.1 phage terminase large subunit [Alphaproteobacteria bacterium]MBU2142755.1 phage terminase large subunit [Alphaproteobacteria bacterium]MBU2195177.1 phage terminase large subunit [Alphaproteobacteria bacterium]